MLIDGTLSINILDFDYDIDLGLNWYKLGNGKYKASDRGSKYDHYTCEITTYGEIDTIETIYTYITSNSSISITGAKAPIFGNNVDYDQAITAVITDYSVQENGSLNASEVKFKLRMTGCTFLSLSNVLPDLQWLKTGYSRGYEYPHKVNTNYYNANTTVNEHSIEKGRFTGTFQFTYDQLAQLQHYQKFVRANAFSMPTIDGNQYPFGIQEGDTGLTCKLLDISNITYVSFNFFTAQITLVQD